MLDFTCSPDDGAGSIVGTAPLEIRCVPLLPEGTWDRVVWTFGDEATAEGGTAAHLYEEPGQFTVSVRLEGYEAPDTGAAVTSEPSSTRFGYVTVCGPPEPAFTYAFEGGLDFRLLNQTPVAPHCDAELRWDVFEGRKISGEPWRSYEVWEPAFTLPREGIWTVVLTVGGIAGTESATLEIDAKYKLTDDLDLGPQNACDTTGGPGALALGALPLALALARRRRR